MLRLTKLRELTLQAGSAPQRPAFISAASGLVRVGDYLYVVADDELHLGVFPTHGDAQGELLRLFPGELPDKPKKRKKHKPDLEVLTRLPPFAKCEHGALLALGSGSTKRRYRGALLPLNAKGRVGQAPRILDAALLFDELQQHFDELNLEGAWVSGNELCLLQRGNKGGSPNAVIHLDLNLLLAALTCGDVIPAITPAAIHTMNLGEVAGVPLCFSDAVPLPDGRWLFSAVAEATDNAYADGACVGAAVGMVDANHNLLWVKPIAPLCKIEGIEVRHSNEFELLLVTDADDPDAAAVLLSARLPDDG